MKLLFTSVGRRVELINAFINAAKKTDIDLRIYGADISETAPALFFCDRKVKTSPISDERYIPELIELCKNEGIDAVIPTIDTDLLALSQNKEAFEAIGTTVFVSDEKAVEICSDKVKTAGFFDSIGLKTVQACENYLNYKGGYPAFIKPRTGSSSINAYKVNDENELKSYTGIIPNYIISTFIDGTEYSVDAFCDIDGEPVFITPRIRLAVRSGEVIKTQIAQDDRIIDEVKKIIKALKPCGAITVQLIRRKSSDEDHFIEINARFGGGAPLSMMAGANSAEALLRILKGEKIKYVEHAAENNAVFCRFDQSIRIK